MIDISNAQLDPYRGFHYFHEQLNIYVKVSLSAALLLVRHTADSSRPDELQDLIKLAHPSWNTPPVREMSLALQREIYTSTSSFALVTIFSAFDDFLIGTKSELHRFYSGPESAGRSATPPSAAVKPSKPSQSPEVDDDDDDSEERLRGFYTTYNWNPAVIEPMLKVIRYFRLCRNCIAHRNGRASRALAKHSSDESLNTQVAGMLDRASDGLRTYSTNEPVHIEPTQAILCSHLLRKIASDANINLLRTLGVDGFLRSVAHHTMFGDQIIRSAAYRTPEAVLNFALTDRYRAKMSDREECIQQMKTLGLWKKYIDVFEQKYGDA